MKSCTNCIHVVTFDQRMVCNKPQQEGPTTAEVMLCGGEFWMPAICSLCGGLGTLDSGEVCGVCQNESVSR